jgi:protein-tyrosine-phosphatase
MRVLVLCHGSVNRSPFVAELIRKEKPNWNVQCAGLKTKPGRPATPKARLAAQRIGLDLSCHRSQPVTEGLVDFADIVLYMDGGNAKRLQAYLSDWYDGEGAQEAWAKCRLLASYGSLRRLRDPNYTSDPVELAKMFKEAELCTMKFLEAHP